MIKVEKEPRLGIKASAIPTEGQQVMICFPIVFTKLRYLEPFRQSYIWMSAKILESQFPPVLVCSTAAYIIASISIFPRGFSTGTTERS